MSLEVFDREAVVAYRKFSGGNAWNPNLTLPQPCGQGVEISGKGPKTPHRLRSALLGHRHPMRVGPDLNPGGMEIELRSLC